MIERRTLLGFLGAIFVAPSVAKAKDGITRHPDYVYGLHPRHKALNAYHPAYRYEGGEHHGEIWYMDSLECRNAQEAKSMAASFLAMTPVVFDRSITYKATGKTVHMVD